LWRANVGGAIESAETPLTGGRSPQPGLDAGAFRVGLSTVLSSGVRLHAAANRRSRFPALRELYSGALSRFEPNPDLKPERFSGLEAGATMFASGVQLQGVFFSNTLSDAILRLTRPDGKFQRINRDQLRSSGIELLGNWRGETVTFGADLMFQHVRVQDPSAAGTARRPENVPELGAGVNLDMKFGESLVTTALNHKGAQYCLHPDLGRNVKLRARTSTDASVAREFTVRSTGLMSRLRAVLAIDNAFDTAIYDQCGLPEPGRTIRLGMSLR
jgi:iron complex outermembrane receptor protein